MSNSRTIKEASLHRLLSDILKSGRSLVAPVIERERHYFRKVSSADSVALPAVNAANSIKEFFFPRWEALFGFKRSGGTVEIVGVDTQGVSPLVVFGARPCDAASLEILDKVFNWDSADSSWNARREAATVIAVGCRRADEYCFCTSVGLSPASRAGADVFLAPAAGDEYIVEAVTAKGEAFVKEFAKHFAASPDVKPTDLAVPKRVDVAGIAKELAGKFDSDLWHEASERCLGCGICTYSCPTCHCFDIQDEADGEKGARFRGWDSCSFALFTKHTSGHNPRGRNASRRRQRIMHKFSYYPALFGIISCTGCGRCGRMCPVDLGVEETLEMIAEGGK